MTMWRVRILLLAVGLASPLLVGAAALAQVDPYDPYNPVEDRLKGKNGRRPTRSGHIGHIFNGW
jgi:hypothetical protein